MTGLDRPVCRETNVIDTMQSGRRRLIVKLEAGGKILRIWPKGLRHRVSLDYATIYRMAVMADAKAAVAAKKAAKQAKKDAR